ncbi:glycosyltransferase family 4 protein [Niallia oryzisoli]|uniref:Glycosyltransferase family 4 protein n=1 Tax=Niallia oryzisoli TaxID=1737571 RepID=A0ABZ2CAE1_9BACI
MKVLMICTEKLPVPPVLGGAIQTYISGILPYIRDKYDVTVLGVNDPTLSDSETIDGIHYARIPGKVFEIYKDEVVNYLQSHQFDLIHIFNRPRLVLPVREAAPNAKITLSMHNDMFYPQKINPEEAAAVVQEVTNIVTISKYVGNVIRELYPEAASKLRHIYSGVDGNQFLPGNHPKMQKVRNELRKANGLENKTVILFAGRLSHNKGVDRLVRALPALAKKHKDLALVIVGSKWFSQDDITDYIAYVKSLANKLPIPVVATGFVSPNEIQNWFAAADIFVCTSLWQEPLARVHYEAMAAGLPIVTTARGGNPEVILVGENGLVVENPDSPAGFEEKLTEILSNRSVMKKMGEKGRELAVTLYTWERVAAEVLEVWEQSFNTPNEEEQMDEDQIEEMTIHETGAVEGTEDVEALEKKARKKEKKARKKEEKAEKKRKKELKKQEEEKDEKKRKKELKKQEEEKAEKKRKKELKKQEEEKAEKKRKKELKKLEEQKKKDKKNKKNEKKVKIN